MLAARDYFAIFFDGDALSPQSLQLDQLSQGKRCRKAAGFAVDDQFNHKSLLFYPMGRSFSIMPNSTARASYSGIT